MTSAILWTFALNGSLAFGGVLAARFVFGQARGMPRLLAAAVIAWAWLTIGMQVFGSFGWLSRGPLLGWSLGLIVVGWIARNRADHGREREFSKPSLIKRRRFREGEAPAEPERNGGSAGASTSRLGSIATERVVNPEPWSLVEVGAIGLVLWTVALLAAPSLLRAVKVVSDGPIYHLYFAARWWKAERLILVAAPFGENAATYFPGGGDLWFSWLMIGWGGDFLAKLGQAPFILLGAIATFALCKRLGASRPAAVVAVCWSVAAAPTLIFGFEPNVDSIFTAAYLLSVYFLIRCSLGDNGLPSLVLAGLAMGLALGTKAPAVVFVPPLIVLGVFLCLRRERGKLAAVLTVVLVPFTVAGFWYARNAALTGNPLYPLHLEGLGKVWLAGWYGPEVMRLSPYYIPRADWRAFLDQTLAVFDPRLAPIWLAALLGLWRIGAVSRGALDRSVWLLSALAIMNVALYWLVIPYRTQQRFFLQALGLAAIPLARLLDRISVAKWLGVGLLGVHFCTWQTWPFSANSAPWDFSPQIPSSLPALIALVGPSSMVLTSLGIGASSFFVAWSLVRLDGGRRSLGVACLAIAVYLGIAGGLFYPWEADARQRFYPVFPDYYRGWLAFDARCGPNGARVAYAGTDLPYYLMGVGLRNEVRYVNVDGHKDWLLHDYQRDAIESGKGPRTWDHPRPGWDRIRPEFEAWLANLRAERIQLLVVTRANPDEGPHNIAGGFGFTIERVWADSHPESFELLYEDTLFRLYRVKPPRS